MPWWILFEEIAVARLKQSPDVNDPHATGARVCTPVADSVLDIIEARDRPQIAGRKPVDGCRVPEHLVRGEWIFFSRERVPRIEAIARDRHGATSDGERLRIGVIDESALWTSLWNGPLDHRQRPSGPHGASGQ